MAIVDRDSVVHALSWRYATKKFDRTRKISEADWDVLEEALHLAPSSYGLQPSKFFVIQDADIRKQLTPVSWKQPQIEECSHLVVATYRTKIDADYVGKFIERLSHVREIPASSLSDYRKMMIGDLVEGPRAKIIETWTQRQTYLAIGFLLETAALLGVDACPMEGIDPAAYDRILQLDRTDYRAVAVVALGYRSPEDHYQKLKKVRLSKEQFVRHLP